MTPSRGIEGGLEQLDIEAAAELLATAGDLAIVVDQDGIVRSVRHSGAEPAIEESRDWVGQRFSELVTSETRAKVDALLHEVALSGVSRRRQLNHPTAAGPDIPVLYTAVRLGRSGHVVAVGRDMRSVSALQQRLVEAQQAMERDYWRLRHVETRYRLLFQLASEAILVVDAQTLRVVDANNAAGSLFAETAEGLLNRAFPFGVEPAGVRALNDLAARARAQGRSGEARVTLRDSGQVCTVSASCFRQESSVLLLVRFTPANGESLSVAGARPRLVDLLELSPDGFVVTDLEGQVLAANQAFLDIAQLSAESQAVGQSIGTWLGRPGADLGVFLTMLKRHGSVRLMSTALRGLHGATSEVEVSAVRVPDGVQPGVGFVIRDIGRRLASGPQGARDLTRAVEQLTGLVGKVSLRELVRDTIDLVERHFIQAALELTQDNRTSAAEVLGVSRQSLYVKLRRHNLLAGVPEGEPKT